MDTTLNSSDVEVIRIRLSGTQDVRNASKLQQSFLTIVSQEKKTIVDCSAIESLDAASLQLFLAAKREAGDRLQFEAKPQSESTRWMKYAGMMEQLLGTSSN